MLLVVALMLLVLMIGGIIVFLVADADRERSATARRLKVIGAPPSVVKQADAADRELLRGDSWLQYLPDAWRVRMDYQLAATGYMIKLKWLIAVSTGCSLLFGAAMFALNFSWVVALVAFLIGAILPPYFVLRFFQARHIKRFLTLFPDAIDLIVRAVRAGLPVNGALDTTGREVPDPVGHEFRLITADMRIGMNLDQALARANLRIRLADFSFFVASLVLQRESGGNLSETLSILSAVLRRRAELRLKIAAMTSEAKTSAYVIASLPFMASIALGFLNPTYITTFFRDPNGGYILGIAAGMLLMGSLVMRSMIAAAAR